MKVEELFDESREREQTEKLVIPNTLPPYAGSGPLLLWALLEHNMFEGDDVGAVDFGELADDLPWSRRTVYRWRQRLEESGLLDFDARPGKPGRKCYVLARYPRGPLHTRNGQARKGAHQLPVALIYHDPPLSPDAILLWSWLRTQTLERFTWKAARNVLSISRRRVDSARDELEDAGLLEGREPKAPDNLGGEEYVRGPENSEKPADSDNLCQNRTESADSGMGEGDARASDSGEGAVENTNLCHNRTGGPIPAEKMPEPVTEIARPVTDIRQPVTEPYRPSVQHVLQHKVQHTTNGGRAHEDSGDADVSEALPDKLDIPMVVVEKIDIKTAEQLQTACGLKQWSFPRLSDAIRAATNEADQKGIGPQPVADAVAELASEDAFSVSNPTALLRKSIWPRHRKRAIEDQRRRERERRRKHRRFFENAVGVNCDILGARQQHRERIKERRQRIQKAATWLMNFSRPIFRPVMDFETWLLRLADERGAPVLFGEGGFAGWNLALEWYENERFRPAGAFWKLFWAWAERNVSAETRQAIMANVRAEVRRRAEAAAWQEYERRQQERERERQRQRETAEKDKEAIQDTLAALEDDARSFNEAFLALCLKGAVNTEVVWKVGKRAVEHGCERAQSEAVQKLREMDVEDEMVNALRDAECSEDLEPASSRNGEKDYEQKAETAEIG